VRVLARHDLTLAAAVLAWIPAVLLADRGASAPRQGVLGLGTWVLLLALLAWQSPMVGVQTMVVVGFATVVEYTFSPLLHVYVYRLHNVPAFVPPGHGLVYLAALAIGRSAVLRQRARAAVVATVVVAGLYAAWGLSPLAPRQDMLGAFWFLCLLGFLRWGRSPLLYVGAFVVVSYLELLGTGLGTWVWQAHDPTGIVSMGNPPSGAAGGYGWFDLAAVAAAGALVARAPGGRLRGQGASAPAEHLHSGVMDESVTAHGAATGEH